MVWTTTPHSSGDGCRLVRREDRDIYKDLKRLSLLSNAKLSQLHVGRHDESVTQEISESLGRRFNPHLRYLIY